MSSSIKLSTEKVITNLSQLSQKADGFRKIAFQKALKSVKDFKGECITREEFIGLQGIGKGILQRFDELVASGVLNELSGAEEELKTVGLFEGVFGVGPITAMKWFNQGYRKLSDIPLESLTAVQYLGIKYYTEINSRIPRREIDEFSIALQNLVKSYNVKYSMNLRAKICGSYLRGRETSGDIDIIVSEEKDSPFIDNFLEMGSTLFQNILSKGDTKVLTLGVGKRRIDLEIVEHRNWAYALLYFTGPMEFNKHMRGIAKNNDYLLNQSGLFFEDTRIQLNTEEEVFAFLDMPFLTPEERDKN